MRQVMFCHLVSGSSCLATQSVTAKSRRAQNRMSCAASTVRSTRLQGAQNRYVRSYLEVSRSFGDAKSRQGLIS